MYRVLFILFLINFVNGKDEPKELVVVLEQGAVRGEKYWDGEYYEFFGVPYASVPKGRDKFQAPLPVEPWTGIMDASVRNNVCFQCYYTDDDEEEIILSGEEDCLSASLLVPMVASEDNPVPVVVYVHSGAFSAGTGNMARYQYLVRHDVLVVNFNYRLGAYGFACLGNKEIPGNAGMKDQVAALKWIKKNINKFGGDPNKITLAGFSVGAAMAELLALSKAADGLFDKLILESGSALSPFTINRDPIHTAKSIAMSLGYNDTGKLEDLTEFYLNATALDLAAKSLNFFLPNSTFGFAPCIENIHEGIEPFLTESPLDILKKGDYRKIPVLTGFSNMEGISRTIKFGSWSDLMNDNFADFLPADLVFKDESTKQAVAKEVRAQYFKDEDITHDNLQEYVDYFSDAMFKFRIMKSLKLHAAVSTQPLYFYEFSYVGKLSMKHYYMDKIKGAGHRDQTAYILDFHGWTNNYRDLDIRDRMTLMWTDFIKYGDPTAFESTLINIRWLPYTNKTPYYMQINKKLQIKRDLLTKPYEFWNKIYEKYYWNPTAPKVL